MGKKNLRYIPSVSFIRYRSRAAKVVVQVSNPPGHSSGIISKLPYDPGETEYNNLNKPSKFNGPFRIELLTQRRAGSAVMHRTKSTNLLGVIGDVAWVFKMCILSAKDEGAASRSHIPAGA